MGRSRRALIVAVVVAAAAAVVAVIRFRKMSKVTAEAAGDSEARLDVRDPVARTADVDKLPTPAAEEVEAPGS